MIDPNRLNRTHLINVRIVKPDKYVVVLEEVDQTTYEVPWEAWISHVRDEIMSSSYDAGYYANQSRLKEKERCEKSPTKTHEQEVASGHYPSVEYRCKYCKTHLGYSK